MRPLVWKDEGRLITPFPAKHLSLKLTSFSNFSSNRKVLLAVERKNSWGASIQGRCSKQGKLRFFFYFCPPHQLFLNIQQRFRSTELVLPSVNSHPKLGNKGNIDGFFSSFRVTEKIIWLYDLQTGTTSILLGQIFHNYKVSKMGKQKYTYFLVSVSINRTLGLTFLIVQLYNCVCHFSWKYAFRRCISIQSNDNCYFIKELEWTERGLYQALK